MSATVTTLPDRHRREVPSRTPWTPTGRPASHLSLVSDNPNPQPAWSLEADRRHQPDGYVDWWASSHQRSREWREIAKEHRAAAVALNACLPSARRGADERQQYIDRLDLSDPATAEAMQRYRVACAKMLDLRPTQPKYLPDLIRATGVLLGVGDPCMASPGQGTTEHRVMRTLFRTACRMVEKLE